MKLLRDKETGEINELRITDKGYELWKKEGKFQKFQKCFRYLSSLSLAYEDYEEPEGFWILDIYGIPEYAHRKDYAEGAIGYLKAVGNYFETEEDARFARDKRVAFESLKADGFKFDGWEDSEDNEAGENRIIFTMENYKNTVGRLDFLFGGSDDEFF